ncbi:outer membrane protein assembly factor BamD [Moraxella bovis]|uniref:outer membrane protein assembly factor BamD n=1 Tax=Moraxella bovis TaxID=476 RepID=UPI000992C7B8|nr:outer membrane protein assembly factor BamD [Moraxella bovis]OOR89726.1 outer membrane protein assembly factor BamD [Moraxella bovis]UZA15482.1 outer membrane protein assembly factor BamD [Moraxella bovis]
MNKTAKLTLTAIMTSAVLLSGCSTLKGIGKKDSEVVQSAEQSELGYYKTAQAALEKNRYNEAMSALNSLRTFYPTGQYAEQALLDLIYAQYRANDFELVTKSTAEFIRSYPTGRHVDYALYVQGVTNMGGAPKASRLFNLDQSQRDVSYLRLAFQDFSNLIKHFPNSAYAPDAAQRMRAIYNDFAEHELVAARWYVKRDAYVAAANRAKWVFQYFPQSDGVPEAIAILAHSNEQLGLTDTANQYKTLLQINYPQYLGANGQVNIGNSQSFAKKALSSISFGRFGRAKDTPTYQGGQYDGATRTQIITSAQALSLPQASPESADIATPKPADTRNTRRIGLGLPTDEAEAGNTNQIP